MISFIAFLSLAVLFISIAFGAPKLITLVRERRQETEDQRVLAQLRSILSGYADDSDETSVEILRKVIRQRDVARAEVVDHRAQARELRDTHTLNSLLGEVLSERDREQAKRLAENASNPTVWEHLDGDDV